MSFRLSFVVICRRVQEDAIEEGSNGGDTTATATTPKDDGDRATAEVWPLFQDRLVEESGILGGQEIFLEDVSKALLVSKEISSFRASHHSNALFSFGARTPFFAFLLFCSGTSRCTRSKGWVVDAIWKMIDGGKEERYKFNEVARSRSRVKGGVVCSLLSVRPSTA